ncbi:uncharacterized protein LOC143182622 [Calliopsis andreniformis]|uniref:uncharacterized protein LOC143182622 n=1 Tax=Calliopsis andreniformis TaxID=337506 RepID=UPI003FCEABAD
MINYDSIVEQKEGKYNCRRASVAKGNMETTHKPVYCRRRISKVRHTYKVPGAHKDPIDCITNDCSDLEYNTSLRSKNKMHDYEDSKKENSVQKQLISNEGDIDSGINFSNIKSKQVSKDAPRLAKEFRKLSKRYKELQEQYQKLHNLLERRETEFQQICSHYEAIAQMLQEMEEAKVGATKRSEKLEEEKVQLNEDIMLLKSIVYQLNVELERYQDKLEKQKVETRSTDFIGCNGKEEKFNQRIWSGVNFHALGPLLNAYRENLSEKQELVRMYEQEMADFGSRCKEILTENEFMHKEVEQLRSECSRYGKEAKSVVENTALLKKQNNLLQKEIIDLKGEANEIRSSYELKIEMISKDNDVLKREHTATLSELNNLKGKYEILSKEFEKVKNKEEQTVPTRVHTSAVEECKTLLDELKYRYEVEKRNLQNQIKHMEENQPENEKQLVMVTAERNHLKTLVESHERNIKRMQRKLEHVQATLYSTRVSRDSLKEQLNKATDYCENLFSEYERIAVEREKLTTLLQETEKENANIDRLGKSITSRVHSLKTELESVRKGAKQQVEIVEKRIKFQEVKVRRMKRDYRRKIFHLKDIIREKEETIEKLQKEKQADRNSSIRHFPPMIIDKSKAVSVGEKIRDS